MKNIFFKLLLIILTLYSPLSLAVSPYIAISIGKNINQFNCLKAAKTILQTEGFQKITQYKASASLFAAYQNQPQYKYKTLVKCLPKLVIVIIVAQTPRYILKKANKLRMQIEKLSRSKRLQNTHHRSDYKRSVPPYISISVGEIKYQKNQTCIATANKVLKNDGFDKIIQYKKNATLFAAYRDKISYKYKAVIKCLPHEGIVIVVVVANSLKNIRQKANILRKKIQEFNHNIEATEDKPHDMLISKIEMDTILSQEICLNQAELAIKKAGFFHHLEINNNYSVKGLNDNQYISVIRCITDENLVVFWVKGKNLNMRKHLLNIIQKEF
jgi:hypothetical protein